MPTRLGGILLFSLLVLEVAAVAVGALVAVMMLIYSIYSLILCCGFATVTSSLCFLGVDSLWGRFLRLQCCRV